MNRRRCLQAAVWAVLALVASTTPVPAGRPRRVRTGVRTAHLEVGGVLRVYRLYVPEQAKQGEVLPLVLAYHGWGETREEFAAQSQLDETAKKHGFLLVYPQGLRRTWDLRYGETPELAFFDALLARLEQQYRVNVNRVYVTGFSYGGFFANLVAAQRSRVIAAIAPHSGSLGVLAQRGINAERKYPVLLIQGARDTVIPKAEGREARDEYRKEGHFVRYVEIPGLGHEWATAADINDRIWRFFRAHPLNAATSADESFNEDDGE